MHLELFFAVLLAVSLGCFFSVPSGVNRVRPGCVSMVCRLLVIPSLVMLGRFRVVLGDLRAMF
jgi:hypothetical protein